MQLEEVSTSKDVSEEVGCFFKMVEMIEQEYFRDKKKMTSFCMRKKEAGVSAALNIGVK